MSAPVFPVAEQPFRVTTEGLFVYGKEKKHMRALLGTLRYWVRVTARTAGIFLLALLIVFVIATDQLSSAADGDVLHQFFFLYMIAGPAATSGRPAAIRSARRCSMMISAGT
jgi:peptidoglycan/LPS O-acetylase OafA/YrhL